MNKNKKTKNKKGFSFKWSYFLAGTILGTVLLFLALGLQQKFLTHTKKAKSDNLVNTYSPPGAAKTPLKLQINGTLPIGNQTVKIPILLYHYLEYNRDIGDTIRTSLAVTPYWFEKQLQYLQENGYQTITFNDLYYAIKKHGELPKKPIILTFDDGYRDFYTDAWPLLKKYKAKATVFIITGFINRPNYMFDWQIKEIAGNSGDLVTLGAHTVHHPALTSLSPNKAYEEILDSKNFLEQNYHKATTVFNYPYGFFNNDVSDLVKKAGFQMAVSTILGQAESKDNIFFFPRIRIGNYSDNLFQERLNINSK